MLFGTNSIFRPGVLIIGLSALLICANVQKVLLHKQIQTLQKANVELAESVTNAKKAIDASKKLTDKYQARLQEEILRCDNRLDLWKKAESVPLREAPNVLDENSSRAYLDGIDAVLMGVQ